MEISYSVHEVCVLRNSKLSDMNDYIQGQTGNQFCKIDGSGTETQRNRK